MQEIIELLQKNSDRAFGGKYDLYRGVNIFIHAAINGKAALRVGAPPVLMEYTLDSIELLTELARLIWGEGSRTHTVNVYDGGIETWKFKLQKWVLIEDIEEREKAIISAIKGNGKD